MTERVHFVSGDSAAGSIKQALVGLGRNEMVLSLTDALGVGPLQGYDDPSLRARWCETRLGYRYWRIPSVRRFWRVAVDPTITPVVWLSSRSVDQLSCLLELVWRRQHPPHVIDVANLDLPAYRYDLRTSVAIIRHEILIQAQVLDHARPLTAREVSTLRRRWHWLRAENAELRVLTPAGLVSASLDHFDAVILARVPVEWELCARVIGNVLGSPELRDEFDQCASDLFLWSRLLALVDDGQLEGQGDFQTMRSTSVRRPPRRSRRR